MNIQVSYRMGAMMKCPRTRPPNGAHPQKKHGNLWQDQPVTVEHVIAIGCLKECESLFLEQPCQY